MGFGYVFRATLVVESASLLLKLFEFSAGRPNRVSPLKFGASYLLVIFFDSEIFLKDFFPTDIQAIIFNPILF
jgi:hypothetical protein